MPPGTPSPCASATRLLPSVILMSTLWLGACGSEGRAPWQPAVDPVWLAEIKAHYRAFALEQRGACKSPVLDRVLDSRVEARSNQRVIVRVRYSYRESGDETQSGACRAPASGCSGSPGWAPTGRWRR